MLHRRVVLTICCEGEHLSFMAFQWNDRPGVSTRPWSLPLTNYVFGTFNIDEFILHYFTFHHRGVYLANSQHNTNTHRTSLQICSEQVQQSHIQKNLRHGYTRHFYFCLHHSRAIIAAVSLSSNCNGEDKQLNWAASFITITLKASNMFLWHFLHLG